MAADWSFGSKLKYLINSCGHSQFGYSAIDIGSAAPPAGRLESSIAPEKQSDLLLDDLHRALMALPHTGSTGFEGLVRDALAELTGQRFRLMKSGPQGGVDSIGDPGGSGLVIGMEGKHYGADTRLPLDALKSKLREAAETFPAMDLWLLATTRQIDGGDADSLRKVGISLGIDVVILDWDNGSAVPPAIATLVAAAPNAAAHHLGANAGPDITAVRTSAYYQAEAERIRNEMRSGSIGYAAASDALRGWIRSHLRDAAAARNAFDSYATLEAADSVRIPRSTITAQLNSWWSTRPMPAVALLGQEGMGKTWSALSWWLDHSASETNFPLTLVVPARDVNGFDGPALLATAIQKGVGLRDVGFWQRRLARWATLEEPRPLILLIIDGLNQKWSFTEWSDLLVSLATPEWVGRVAVMLTCRPDHWTHRLKSLSECPVPISPIQVEPFNDSELDAVLSPHMIKREDLAPRLLSLIRIPRMSDLAISRRAELQSGDITPERLVYEDWRHRHHRAQQTISHIDFQTFVSGLGREIEGQIGPPLTRAQLLDRLSADGGLPREHFEGVLSELIDGGWLEPFEDVNRFRLKAERVPAALGLTLLDSLRREASEDAREEIFAHRLDPLQGSDISVAILRYAVTFSIVDADTPDFIRRTLVDRWTKAQNFSPQDFESFWRLIGHTPIVFIDLAEANWFKGKGNGREDEVFVKGISNAWRWSNVANLCENRLTNWFSRYWLDPLEGEVMGKVVEDDRAIQRREATRKRAAVARSEDLERSFGLTLIEVDAYRQAWGSYRAVELLSWLPRAPLIQVFTAWAITRAIIGGWRQHEAMAWVLRWNVNDCEATEAALIARCEELLSAGGEIAREAARHLTEGLASSRAMKLRDDQFATQDLTEVLSPEWRSSPAGSRFEKQPLATVMFLEADPCDPNLDLPKTFVERLERLVDETSDAALVIEESNRDTALDRASLALARWAPSHLIKLERRRARAAANASQVRRPPSRWVQLWRRLTRRTIESSQPRIVGVKGTLAALPLLDEEAISQWRSLGLRARDLHLPADFARDGAMFADASAAEQIQLLKYATPSYMPERLRRLLAKPTANDFLAVEAQLDASHAPEHLRAWLNYLEQFDEPEMPTGWQPVALLLDHHDVSVRTSALRLVWKTEDRELADVFERTGWTYTAGQQREEIAWGSLVLALSTAAETGQIIGRVHPDTYGDLTDRYPDIGGYRNAFVDHVFSEIEHLQTAKSIAYPRALLAGRRGWKKLTEDHGNSLIAWMWPFTHPDKNKIVWFLVEKFPYFYALDAVDQLAPGSKARAIIAGLREGQRSNVRSGELFAQAAKIGGSIGEEIRQFVLDEANDDQKLFDFSCGLQKHEQTEWLVAQIERDLSALMPGLVARGITLAGCLMPGPAADRLWTGALSNPPATGWLKDVHALAHGRYQRFSWALHWNRQFQDTNDIGAAFAAHALLVACVDDRVFSGDHRPSSEAFATWSWRKAHIWTFGWDSLQAAIKKDKDALAKTFLGSKLPLSNQYPRRR